MILNYKAQPCKPVMSIEDGGASWWLNKDAGFLRPETIDALMIHNVEKVKSRVVVPQHWLVFDGDAKENTCQ